jgi:hypothetical protein
MTNSAVKPRRLGVIGCIVGLLALVAAVLPHWFVPAMFPPPQSEQGKTNTGQKPHGRFFIGRREGVEQQIQVRDEGTGDRLMGAFSTAAISLSLLAIVLAVLSLIFREEKLLAGVSAALGTVALAIEVAYILAPYAFLLILILFFLAWLIN